MSKLIAGLTKLLSASALIIGIEPNSTSHLEKWLSAMGAFLGIAAVYWVSHWYLDGQGALLMVASMGASEVLLFAVPHGALSQPWPLVAGHLSSAFIGIASYKLLGDWVWTPALAVGMAVGAMHYLRCIHPPGGATALTAVIGSEAIHALGFKLMLFPIAINLIAILVVTVLFNSPFKWRRYPSHFASRYGPTQPRGSYAVPLTHEDFASAMLELNSLIDVTPEDLAQLFELASTHAERNAAHPAQILAGRYYSNGQLGRNWSIRQTVDSETKPGMARGQVIYKTLAGDDAYSTGLCTTEEFRLWAGFEVVPSEGHWVRVDRL